MDFVNESGVHAGWTMGFERDGRELLVVAIKATFRIPESGEAPVLAEEQVPLTEADEFTGEPGLSAMVYESDFAHRKLYCDVLLNGSAYAPEGKPATIVPVGLKVAGMTKVFNVVGDRRWEAGAISVAAGRPKPFVVMPISYNNAFGGVDNFHEDPSRHRTYLPNPVGKGFHDDTSLSLVDGTPLPNTEEINNSVTMVGKNYQPMAFGPIGRNFGSRYPLAGTYDQEWLDKRAPFWPDNFDYRYFQAAPSDQQISFPKGGEEVAFKNFTPKGIVRFKLPVVSMPVLLRPYKSKDQEVKAIVDTILIEPGKDRFMLIWRVSYPLRKSCFDLMQVIAGKNLRDWYGRQRFGSKPYYRSLDELIRVRRR